MNVKMGENLPQFSGRSGEKKQIVETKPPSFPLHPRFRSLATSESYTSRTYRKAVLAVRPSKSPPLPVVFKDEKVVSPDVDRKIPEKQHMNKYIYTFNIHFIFFYQPTSKLLLSSFINDFSDRF